MLVRDLLLVSRTLMKRCFIWVKATSPQVLSLHSLARCRCNRYRAMTTIPTLKVYFGRNWRGNRFLPSRVFTKPSYTGIGQTFGIIETGFAVPGVYKPIGS